MVWGERPRGASTPAIWLFHQILVPQGLGQRKDPEVERLYAITATNI